jgi:hypothetical protein
MARRKHHPLSRPSEEFLHNLSFNLKLLSDISLSIPEKLTQTALSLGSIFPDKLEPAPVTALDTVLTP